MYWCSYFEHPPKHEIHSYTLHVTIIISSKTTTMMQNISRFSFQSKKQQYPYPLLTKKQNPNIVILKTLNHKQTRDRKNSKTSHNQNKEYANLLSCKIKTRNQKLKFLVNFHILFFVVLCFNLYSPLRLIHLGLTMN